MLPKKPAEIVKQTAREMGLPEDTVDKVVSFFWKEVRKAMVEMKAPMVQVPNFGRFMVRPHMLSIAESNCNKYLERTEPLTFHRAAVRKDVEDRLEKIKKLKEMCDLERERKKEVKLTRNGKVTEGRMEEPETDS